MAKANRNYPLERSSSSSDPLTRIAILGLLIVSGCAPYQRIQDQWAQATGPTAQAPTTAPPSPSVADSATAPARPASDSNSTGASPHGEEISPFGETSSSMANQATSDDILPPNSTIDPISADLLEEFQPSASDRTSSIDSQVLATTPLSNEAVRQLSANQLPDTASSTADSASTVSESPTDAAASAVSAPPAPPAPPTVSAVTTGSTETTGMPATSDNRAAPARAVASGPPAPPWQRSASRQSAIQGFTSAVSARSTTPNATPSSVNADTLASSNTPSQETAHSVPAGDEAFDPFEGTGFQSPTAPPTEKREASRVVQASATVPVTSPQTNKKPLAARSMVTQPVSPPVSNTTAPATKRRPLAPAVPSELAASMGETLLSQSNFRSIPTITPLQLSPHIATQPTSSNATNEGQENRSETSDHSQKASATESETAPNSAKPQAAPPAENKPAEGASSETQDDGWQPVKVESAADWKEKD